MEFKISNDGETTNQSTSDADSTPKTSLSLGSDYEADDSDAGQEDSVFIANQYQRPEDSDSYGPMDPIDTSSSVGAGTYLSQNTTFTPILMYIGVGLQVFAFIYMIFQFTSMDDIFSAEAMNKYFNILAVGRVFIALGAIVLLVDSILTFAKTRCSFSIILWALFFPYVYFFKRFKINGDSYIIPIAIIVVYVLVAVFYYFAGRQAIEAMFDPYTQYLQNQINQSNLIFLKSFF